MACTNCPNIDQLAQKIIPTQMMLMRISRTRGQLIRSMLPHFIPLHSQSYLYCGRFLPKLQAFGLYPHPHKPLYFNKLACQQFVKFRATCDFHEETTAPLLTKFAKSLPLRSIVPKIFLEIPIMETTEQNGKMGDI